MFAKLKGSRRWIFPGVARDNRGSIAILVTFMVPVMVGVAGLSVDVGLAYVAKKRLQEATQAAALAGAAELTKPNATEKTVATAIAEWQKAVPAGVTVASTTTKLACDSTTADLPICNATYPNVVRVTQTTSTPTYFLKVLGKESFEVSASGVAATGGGGGSPIQVMFVIDLTGSMSLHYNLGCTIPAIAKPTKMQCAMFAIQNVLKALPTSVTKVGLMAFPGREKKWEMGSTSCGTQPNVVRYLTPGIQYQIGTALESDFNDGAGGLKSAAPIVRAVGDYSKGYPAGKGCLETASLGSVDSYGAEAIEKAHAALPVVKGVQNVIIFLSDGDYNSPDYFGGLPGGLYDVSKKSNQCQQAIDAASNATAAGTTVYSVAFGNPTTKGCPFDTPAINPCMAMQRIASDPTRYYTSDCNTLKGALHPPDQIPQVLNVVRGTLTKPRLLPQ